MAILVPLEKEMDQTCFAKHKDLIFEQILSGLHYTPVPPLNPKTAALMEIVDKLPDGRSPAEQLGEIEQGLSCLSGASHVDPTVDYFP